MTIPKQILLVSAHHHNEMIAAAFYLNDDTTLYGRYWGSKVEIDGLHFECCYYQGIEYSIKNNLDRFDPGAQGEHKIQRGFTPIQTHSFHYLAHPGFANAVERFVLEEQIHIESYITQTRSLLPFKADEGLIDKMVLCAKAT